MRTLLTLSICLFLAIPVAAQDAAKWTTIKGQIIYPGEPPKPEEVVIDPKHQDRAVCLKNGKFFKEEWVVNQTNKGIRFLFVSVLPADTAPGNPFPKALIHPDRLKPAKEKVELDQPCCQFIPHAVAAQAGQTLLIKNSATIAHSARYDTLKNGGANPNLGPGAKHEIANLQPERSPFQISCGQHQWMNAWVMVYDHPYFAVTDENGHFEIKDMPRGKFTLYVRRDNGLYSGGKNWKKDLKVYEATEKQLDLGKIEFKVEPKTP